jgi:hypothetical protein
MPAGDRRTFERRLDVPTPISPKEWEIDRTRRIEE